MISFLKQLAKKWSGWVGDRDMEIALRSYLDNEGYFGDSAAFEGVRLAAVQRPGWLQIYIFNVEAKPREEAVERPVRLFGLVRQDERYKRQEIETFRIRSERNARLDEWSTELIRLRRTSL